MASTCGHLGAMKHGRDNGPLQMIDFYQGTSSAMNFERRKKTAETSQSACRVLYLARVDFSPIDESL